MLANALWPASRAFLLIPYARCPVKIIKDEGLAVTRFGAGRGSFKFANFPYVTGFAMVMWSPDAKSFVSG
jgi:hypothetical protein